MQIREATLHDIPDVQAVAWKTWTHTYAGIIPQHVQKRFVGQVYCEDALEWRMKRGVFLVAVEGGRVVGFADFNQPYEEEDAVALAAIYVLPEIQGRGAGSQLLKAGIRSFSSAKRLVVRVERDNASGRRFYEARGFEKTGEFTSSLYSHETRMVEMVLDLGDGSGG